MQAVVVDQTVYFRQLLLAVRTARTTEDHQHGRRQAVGPQFGQGVNGHGQPLEGLDAPGEEDDGIPGRQPDRPAGLGPGARAEKGVVHAGRHDGDPFRSGPVEVDELLGLHRTGGHHGVGATDDLRFGLGPAGGLPRRELLRAGVRLDPVQGVEGHEQRHVQLVLEGVAGQT